MLMPYYLPEKRRKTIVNWYRYKVQSINCIFFSKIVKYIYLYIFPFQQFTRYFIEIFFIKVSF